MKTKFLGLRTAIYKVSQIGQAKDWYSRVLDSQPYFDEPYYVGFNVGGFELGLMPDQTPAVQKIEGVVTYWGVEDIEKAFERLIDAGATAYENPEEVGGGIMTATVKDPWGNVLGIIYNPHFEG